MNENVRKASKTKIIVAMIGALGMIFGAIVGVFGDMYLQRTKGPMDINVQAYIQENDSLKQVNASQSDENGKLHSQIQNLQDQIEDLNDIIGQLQAQIDEYENEIRSSPPADISSTNEQDKESTYQSQASQISPIAVAWKDKATYESYSGNGNNGFVMFGTTYTNGFTISMGASFNMWGNGEQYVTYNISSISEKYSTLKLTVGHVDDYESSNIIVRFYLDETIDDSADYEYIISPNIAPQELSIDIVGKKSMTIYVSNQGSGTNKIGFANFTFE